jgi:hypothetical protein
VLALSFLPDPKFGALNTRSAVCRDGPVDAIIIPHLIWSGGEAKKLPGIRSCIKMTSFEGTQEVEGFN